MKLEDETKKIVGLIRLAKSSGWFLPHKNICWVSERHNILNRDERGRLHSIVGPAIMYPDGWSIYAVHGVRVPKEIIENQKSITIQLIEKESNAEVRRVMIDLYGQSRFLIDSGAEKIHEDEFGTLFRKYISHDEPLVMVKVINSTPEPNGTFKNYFLRVHPELRPMNADGSLGEPQKLTARNAVASTFGKSGNDYILSKES